jgi:hypothetical protein
MRMAVTCINDINQQVTQVLYREIGVVNTIRFFNQFSTGCGDYTEERRPLVENLTIDEIISDIGRMRSGKEPGNS